MGKSTPHITGDLAEKSFRYQMRMFKLCVWATASVGSLVMILLFVLLTPAGKAFFAMGPQVWYMTLLKLPVILVPVVFAGAGIFYLAFMLAAVFGVMSVHLHFLQLRMPEAHVILLQFYSDPRFLDASPCYICGPMRKNKKLIRWCKKLAAVTISRVYGTYPGITDSVD